MDEIKSELQAANDCIVDILESYLEFLQYTIDMPKAFIKATATARINKWKPVLEITKKKQSEYTKVDGLSDK